jgi:FAD synthetase
MQKKVLVFGTFDVLHEGHANFLKQAKALGDELHVVIARDETVEEVKNHKALYKEQQRMAAVKAVPEVDEVHLGHLTDKYLIIEEIKPDIIALGYDQNAFVEDLSEECRKRGIESDIIRLEPFHPEKYKSSKIKSKTPSRGHM